MKFEFEQRARIDRTTDPELDGKEITVIGVAAEVYTTTFYIVMFDMPLSDGARAKQLIEHCLDPV